MASDAKFWIRWSDYESQLTGAFRHLRDQEAFFDVTLVADEEHHVEMGAHQVVLSACSPFFCRLLLRHPHPKPIIFLKGVKWAELEAIVTFMYHGELSVPHDHLEAFLEAAETLKVKGLTASDLNTTTPTSNRTTRKRSRPANTPKSRKKIPLTKLKETAEMKATGEDEDDHLAVEDMDSDVDMGDTEALPLRQEEPAASGEEACPVVKVEPAAANDKDTEKLRSFHQGVRRPYEVLHNASLRKGMVYVCDGFNYTVDNNSTNKNGNAKERIILRCRKRKSRGITCPGRATLFVATDEFIVKAEHVCHLQEHNY